MRSRHRQPRRLGVRIALAAATVAVLAAGTAGALTLTSAEAPAASLAPAPTSTPAPVAAPPVTPARVVPAADETEPAADKTTSAATTSTTKTKAKPKGKTAAECDRIALRSDQPNSELRPYLRSIGCDSAADGLLVGAAGPDASDGTDAGLCDGPDADQAFCDPSYMPDTGTTNDTGTSGESQYEYGCRQGYITEGC